MGVRGVEALQESQRKKKGSNEIRRGGKDIRTLFPDPDILILRIPTHSISRFHVAVFARFFSNFFFHNVILVSNPQVPD